VSVSAVVAAAGSGERLGAGGPKAFVPLAGRRMVEWSVAAFRAAPSVGSIVVACPPRQPLDLAGGEVVVVDGGARRAESVANALEVVDTELVAIHDAARPLVTPELIEAVLATLQADPDASGAIAATPVTDTIKQVEECPERSGETKAASSTDSVSDAARVPLRTLDRERLWAAQTPQVFRLDALREALAADPERVAAATDESMIVEAAGGRVLIHPSTPENLKVTTPLDLRLAELLLAEQDPDQGDREAELPDA
jgi:2-C-methyl-D-erythritol 4-phosphate cytidylyltransferase